jgi:hypothetical protein
VSEAKPRGALRGQPKNKEKQKGQPAAELAANRIQRAKPVSEAKPRGALRGQPKNKEKTKRPAGSRIGGQSNSKGEAREAKYKQDTININTGGN